jgi:hypothetical protein
MCLERCGVSEPFDFLRTSLAEHEGGKWCAGARPDIEFAAAYAKRSGVTVEWLKLHGREVAPCDCGEPECEGWQMAHVNEFPLEIES